MSPVRFSLHGWESREGRGHQAMPQKRMRISRYRIKPRKNYLKSKFQNPNVKGSSNAQSQNVRSSDLRIKRRMFSALNFWFSFELWVLTFDICHCFIWTFVCPQGSFSSWTGAASTEKGSKRIGWPGWESNSNETVSKWKGTNWTLSRPFSSPPEVSPCPSLLEGSRGMSPPAFPITTIDPEPDVPHFLLDGKRLFPGREWES